MADLQMVMLVPPGKPWHTIRYSDDTWQPSFGDVKHAVPDNDPGPFQAVGCAEVSGDLHVVALTGDGRMWHTIRYPQKGWQSDFGDVNLDSSAGSWSRSVRRLVSPFR